MFDFFHKKNKISDIEWLGVDIHSHILPGIDDGSKEIGQSLGYIHEMQELGFSRLVCTPHIFQDLYPNTPETILPVLKTVQEEVKKQNLSIEIHAAAEYMADSEFVVKQGLLVFPGKHILIEMSYLMETPNIENIIFELQLQGYQVILAHPERYNFYFRHTERYENLKNIGCSFQLNILSVLGYYGKGVKAMAEHLLNAKMYDFAGTDLHHDKHMKMLSDSVKSGRLHTLVGHYGFKNKEVFTNDVFRTKSI
ncbi:MAG: histidinol phosphatase [Pedobacter sp.]|nr:histidinol phosphatase [Pedobacter sp.]